MQQKVIVIGSGVAGLAVSIRLAQRGYAVHVFEANQNAGGKVSWIKKDGFQWGLGASLLTFPEYIDELFYLCGKNPSDYYYYHRLNPITKYFFADGSTLNAYANTDELAKEIELKFGISKELTQKYLHSIGDLYNLTEGTFLHQSLHKLKTYLTKNAIRVFTTNPFKMGLMQTVHSKNVKTFKNKNVVQLFDRYPTYNGSDPYKAPAILSVIAHAEFNKGGFMMHDGMPSVAENLYKLATEMGVEFSFNTKVSEILIDGKKAVGVRCYEKKYFADTIVSNMDINFTYEKLLLDIKSPKIFTQQKKSTSAIIFYWGMNKIFPQLDVHNILFSDDYENEFKQLSHYHIADDATIYIFISSKINKKHAIENGENWFVLINVPHHKNQDWETLVKKHRRLIMAKISKYIGEDIEKCIVAEEVNFPKSIEEKTSSYLGALYGNSFNKVISSFLRHPNFSSKLKNLYFCGGSVHPGGGVPISLLSAKITDEIIQK